MLMTRFTPLTRRASSSAAAFASFDGTMPKRVRSPSTVSTLMSSAGVRRSASRRSFVADVISRSRAASLMPRSSRARGPLARPISASVSSFGLSISLATRRTPGTRAASPMARRCSLMVLALPARSTTPSFTDRTAMRLPASALSVPSAFSTSSRISASARLTSLSRWPPTTWRMLRTSFTPSTVLTASSALAVSSAVRTLPCKVMRPFTVSTLMVPPRSPSVASRAILALVVIQASRVLARAARVPVSARTAASAAPPIHVATRIMLSLQGTGRAPRARSRREPSPRQGRPGRVETYTSTSRATLQGRVLGADPAGWALFTRASRPFGDAGSREPSDQPRPSLKEVLRGFLQDNRNAMLGSAPLAALAVLCFGGVGVYIVNPSLLMSWSSVHVPNSIRWLGAGLGWTGALGEIWALVYLGRQYSRFLRVRRGHELVVQGPYAWVRHPVYSFGIPMLAGLGLVAANWLIVATGIGAIAMAMVQRTPKEEAMLIEAFGDSYRRYCERTGRFFPRLH